MKTYYNKLMSFLEFLTYESLLRHLTCLSHVRHGVSKSIHVAWRMFEYVQHSRVLEIQLCHMNWEFVLEGEKRWPLMLAPRWGLEGFRTSIRIKTPPHVGIEISPFLMCIYYRAFLSNFVHFNCIWCNYFFYLPFFHVTCTYFFPSANCFYLRLGNISF